MATLGRPTKYRPEMCDKVIELMKEGASLVEVAGTLDIDETTLHDWKANNKEFSKSIKRGIRLSEAWWQRMGRENLFESPDGMRFNYTGWYMNMKNRFGWADKQEIEQKTLSVAVTVEAEQASLVAKQLLNDGGATPSDKTDGSS